MPKITKDYINNKYIKIYNLELKKELKENKYYTPKQKDILQKELRS